MNAAHYPGGVFEYHTLKAISNVWGQVWEGLNDVLEAGGVYVLAGSMAEPTVMRPVRSCHESTAEQIQIDPDTYTPYTGFYFLGHNFKHALPHSFYFDKSTGKFTNACPVAESISVYIGFAVSPTVFLDAIERLKHHGMKDNPLEEILNHNLEDVANFAREERELTFSIIRQNRVEENRRSIKSRKNSRKNSRKRSRKRSRKASHRS